MFILSQLDNTIYNTENISCVTLQKRNGTNTILVKTTEHSSEAFDFFAVASYTDYDRAYEVFLSLFDAMADDFTAFSFPFE